METLWCPLVGMPGEPAAVGPGVPRGMPALLAVLEVEPAAQLPRGTQRRGAWPWRGKYPQGQILEIYVHPPQEEETKVKCLPVNFSKSQIPVW